MIQIYQILALYSCIMYFSSAYVIDEDNYFYINSSFSRQTASFSMCFHFNEPTTVLFESAMLFPTGNHTTFGDFSDEVSAKFTPPFERDLIGYNNYDSGEYWFGIKYRQDTNERQGTFEKLKLTITIESKIYNYVFLAPLFVMPLNAFEVEPTNTLFGFSDWLLISYLHKYNEVDAYFFAKKGENKYKLM
jgi:hypothetical protein